jgi:hypothetical protein
MIFFPVVSLCFMLKYSKQNTAKDAKKDAKDAKKKKK